MSKTEARAQHWVPHTFILLIGLMLAAAAATYVTPAGEFERVINEGSETVVPGSYRPVPSKPAGLMDLVLAFPRGLEQAAPIVFFILIVGGAFRVVEDTGAMASGIGLLIRRLQGRTQIIVPALTALFALGGGIIGMAEETLAFLPALLYLSRSMGYDPLVAGGIGLVGAGAGFAGAFLNPFTIGVAQTFAGLPLFSGLGFRLLAWSLITLVTVGFMDRYARRVLAAPGNSPLYRAGLWTPESSLPSPEEKPEAASGRHAAVGLMLLAVFSLLIFGTLRWGWGIPELTGLFFVFAFLSGPVGGMNGNTTAESFVAGAARMAAAALVVGLARAVLVLLTDASVLDTIMFGLAAAVQSLPPQISILGMYLVQSLLNFLVPSGSGQAAISIPILAPLADLMGVTRQTVVLAYQFGDGFTNVFTPTQGYFMAGLALIEVPWQVWARWVAPLLLVWWVLGALLLLVAHALQLQ